MASSGRRGRLSARAARWLEPGLLALSAMGLLAGGVAWGFGARDLADAFWAAGTVAAIPPSVGWVIAALRRGRAGVDVIATLALVGTLVVGEYLAGSLIALMLATGRTLDAAAERRASRDLRTLLERAPRTARRRVGDEVEQVPLESVVAGDVLIVGSGEVVPVDGRVTAGSAVLDESALTGEPVLVEYGMNEAVRSGTVNASGAFELAARATAQESTYAEIVRLAEQAGAERAPMVRLAERYAAWFLPLSLAIAGLAWVLSGSAARAVAVLVVATPCPLLLAAPVAIVSGLSRASRLGVIVRDGTALEQLGRARTLVLDKTGTVTVGRPRVIEVAAATGFAPGDVLGLAASVDQVSTHVLAQAIVREARRRKASITVPANVVEEPGVVRPAKSTAAWSRSGASIPPPMRCRPGRVRSRAARCSTVPLSCGSASTARRSVRCCCATRCVRTPRTRCTGCAPRVLPAWSCSPETAPSPPEKSARCSASTRCAPSRARRTKSPRSAKKPGAR